MSTAVIPSDPAERNAFLASLCARTAQGESFAEIAESLGVHRSLVNRWLLSKVPDEYREAQEAGVVARLAEQGEKLEAASNHVDISRARETARYWCWIAERLLPRFAAKQEVGAPGEFKALEDRELARRYAYLEQVARTIDAEVVSESGTT